VNWTTLFTAGVALAALDEKPVRSEVIACSGSR
jgi:hypothetical protein